MSYFIYALSYFRIIVIISLFYNINEAIFAPNLMASDKALGNSKNLNVSHEALFDERVQYALDADIVSLAKGLKTRKSDCEALVHFIQTGVPTHYSKEIRDNVWPRKAYAVNPLTVTHQPYTGYVLLTKNKDYMWETHGKWGFVHAFIVTGDGLYLSRNGFGPIRTFRSYKDMLLVDGFPHSFVDDHGSPIERQEGVIPANAVVGESIIFSLQDVTGDKPPTLTEE